MLHNIIGILWREIGTNPAPPISTARPSPRPLLAEEWSLVLIYM